ncbi:MFS transporter [Paucibacter sp. DJ2R-2]|uniref:MFS transporter n=1 Tax=Paucibacter sp. DJ2R-2 TaxID=2893558 RepID=UPI0021E40633|nr:MFS transporter [Paucibacter sp. DJ2R-2]MCV2422063.1 MFS transporter [Paucibacter sp. DJ4R-1]MCV2439320.1 MFS transporter [Paucibacter sp. DJ2R-2]
MRQQRHGIVIYILVIWFAISFVTNLIGPLMPVLIEDFHLSLGMAGFLPFSFFLAYGLVSIPGGLLVERRGARFTLALAFALNLIGALAIALQPVYAVVIGGLFVIGLGMALLQVVINPLMRTAGGEANFAFYSVMGQLVFGLASFISPWVFQRLMARPPAHPGALVWVDFYWAFVFAFAALVLLNQRLPLPQVELREDERMGGWLAYRELLRRVDVWCYFLAIVAYVGTEQTLANWMSQFLSSQHGLSATAEGADAVGQFWGLMSLGCLLGLLLLKLMDSRRVLALFVLAAMASVAAALFGSASLALWAFPAAGFCLSVMFSVLFSLALNSVPLHHGAFSGILCTGILGGAVLPMLVGQLAETTGLRLAMCSVFLSLAYIFSVSIWARPLVSNQMLPLSELLQRARRRAPATPAQP